MQRSPDVLIVGGGIVGLAVAVPRPRRAAPTSLVLDAGEAGAWAVAAGMLAPGHGGRARRGRAPAPRPRERRALPRLRRRARRRAARGRHAGRRARPRRGRGAGPPARVPHRRSACTPSACARPRRAAREPALAPTVRLALDVPGDRSVDPRALVAALRERVDVRDRGRVEAVLTRRRACDRRAPRRTARCCGAGQVVLATGARTRRRPAGARARAGPPRQGPGAAAARPGRPRAGRALDPHAGAPTSSRAPTAATSSARRWRSAAGTRAVTAGGVFELLRDLSEVVPGRARARARGGARRLPARHAGQRARRSGRGALDGLVWATGHWRNGVLLAPVTADLVAGLLAGEPLPEWAGGVRPAPLRRGGARDERDWSTATPAELPDGRHGGERRRGRSSCRPRAAASPWPSTRRSSRAARGTGRRSREGARVEVVHAVQGG